MTQNDYLKKQEYLKITGQIVAAHVSKTSVQTGELPYLIETVYNSVVHVDNSTATQQRERPQPAVSIRKSVQPDYLICLEDGKQLKMLKRYLKTNYDMTPDEYRERWGLSSDYPMVSPNYAKKRSQLAKDIGLGKTKRK